MNHSYWDRAVFPKSYDAAVIGAGIVGLSTALHLKQQHPTWRVAVFERGLTSAGASTKNAGFACFGSLSEIIDDLESMPEEDVIALIRERWQGLEYLLKLTKGFDIGYVNNGGYELFGTAHQVLYAKCSEQMSAVNALMNKHFGQAVFANADDDISQFGFGDTKHLLVNPFEGQIDTGKLMLALVEGCRRAGVHLYFGAAVEQWISESEGVCLAVGQDTEIRCNQLVVATNGFARELLPELAVRPTRAQCLVTEPIPELKVRGTFHMDRGYYYFRNIDQRILLGGARNIAIQQEYTTNTDTSATIQQELERVLKTVILPGADVRIEQRWTGTMGTGPSKQPIVERISDRVVVAVRLAGMGIAIGSRIGQRAADMVSA